MVYAVFQCFEGHCIVVSVILRSTDEGFWACLGDLPPDMPGRPGTWVFAMQFNAEIPWHFAQLRYPWVG